MNLIPSVAETAEKDVIEQITYQTVLYFPLTDPEFGKQTTLSGILEVAIDNPGLVEQPYVDALQSIIGENGSYPELGEAVIDNKSWDKESGGFDSDGFQACTFELNGEINVCFRGTPGGAWIDNGYGMAGGDYLIPYENAEQGVSNLGVSPMQHNALEYMQSIVDKNEGKVINISGHSKGGNETQLAALVFADKINAAYNFDGQGFPPDVVEQLKDLPGWEEGLKKLYSIHADNDYVHGLGQTITLPENTVYLYTPDIGTIPTDEMESLLMNHYITALLTDDGHLQRQTIEGPLAETVGDLSNAIMSIDDPEMRANICLGIMALLQEFYSGDPPVGGTETSMDILIDNTLSLLGKVTTNPKTYAVLALLAIPAARRNIGTSLLTAIANSDLTEYLLTGQSDIDQFLAEHDFKTEEDIANFLKEHTESGKQEYLVRGALLRCRYGTHARQLNLKKCHGIYVHGHPCIHARNCLVGEEENITWYGICKAPSPPPTEVVHLTKDVPRNPQTGDRTGDAPGGHESGHKCQPEIVGAVWMDAYEQTPIVDNGDLDPADRARVKPMPENFSELTDEEQAEALASPQGIPTTTTLSFLICKYGGLIEPYNSGQQYDPDEPLD